MAKTKTEPKIWVTRIPGRKSSFRRSIPAGEELKLIVFEPDRPVALTQQQFEVVRRDMGHALVIIIPRASGRGDTDFDTDWEKTSEIFEECHGRDLEKLEEVNTKRKFRTQPTVLKIRKPSVDTPEPVKKRQRRRKSTKKAESKTTTKPDSNAADSETEKDGDQIEVSGELIVVLEANAKEMKHPDFATPEGLKEFVANEGVLADLPGFTDELVTEAELIIEQLDGSK
ncbi:hypothetical protein [Rhodopirellula sp. SWK7]|uniref:hypothetical protein n=1 Tax=Rhodopirellula sp. SWK7 TaxID=595460 RepID=UPI0002BF19A1|nr:hypothetical protein [Rhodopirellula sp. SWK7]EMI47378.1 hypothetical protein RRSWK_00109 [Rhodopirellula sp. SWK7]